MATMSTVTGEDATLGGSPIGHDGNPLPPPRRNTSLRPALVVAGIAVVLLILFGVGSALSGGGGSTPPRSTVHLGPVTGTSLRAVAATRALAPIEQAGEPPANVVAAIVIPQGATRVGVANNSLSAGDFDEQVTFSVHASEASVFAFYRTEMRSAGWHIESSGPSAQQPGLEVLGQLAGSDGFYWEMGALVSPSTFVGTSSVRAPGASDDLTRFTIRVFQASSDAA